MNQHKSEVQDGMRIDWDVPIPMDDGIVLRGDLFRPVTAVKCPVIMSYGPYAKGAAFQEKYKRAWDALVAAHPEIMEGSTNKYQNWELVDPEKWVPDGYAVLRIDARGAGRSPGFMDPWSPRENQDFYTCIEWAAAQPWSNGKVGLNGISYYAMNAWTVATLQPPSLTAICAWEGASDYYRELIRHGGILSDFIFPWYPRALISVQHGIGEGGWKNPNTGESVAGPHSLSAEELAENRIDMEKWVFDNPLDGPSYRERSADFDKINVPILSSGNWGGQGLHTRGNFEGFVCSESRQKWLEVHGDEHWAEFYTDYGATLQKRFFGHFLKGEDTGWSKQPTVQLQVRYVDRFVERHENEWPLARTSWIKFYLDSTDYSLRQKPSGFNAQIEFEALGPAALFVTTPFEQETEITGPIAAKLFVSSNTVDADVILGLRLFGPDNTEIVFQGSNDARTAIGHGWLRASHRKLDHKLSRPYRPYHTHDEIQLLKANEIADLDIEIWPTSIVVPAGYRIGLTIGGKDCSYDDPPYSAMHREFKTRAGVGPFHHDHPKDRPVAVFGGKTTLHFNPGRENYLLLPIIPPTSQPN